MSSVADLFALDGSLFDESVEFQGVKLSSYIDGRAKITPSFEDRVTMRLKTKNAEVTFRVLPWIVYGWVEFLDGSGIETMLFKCRQKKNLTKFIRNVLSVASMSPSKIHNDFRNN